MTRHQIAYLRDMKAEVLSQGRLQAYGHLLGQTLLTDRICPVVGSQARNNVWDGTEVYWSY